MTNKNINKIIKGDKILIIIVVTLMLVSALLMGSTLTKMALDTTTFSFKYLFKQLFLSGMAFALMLFASKVPYQTYYKLSKFIFGFAVILTVITMVFGIENSNARRWLNIPIINLSFQTSDLVRVAIVIYVATIISHFNFKTGNATEMLKKVLLPTLIVTVLTAVNDLSTAALMYVTIFAIIFVTPINKKLFWKIFAIISVSAVILFVFAISTGLARGKTWENRIIAKNSGYNQKLEGQIAISNGGLFLKPGKSEQKHIIENSYSDYVFSIAAEEYGIFGVILIIVLYIIFIFRAALIIKKQKRSFPLFLTIGITLNIIFQAFMHIVVNIGIMPVTGQTLPLVSHGGTSMVVVAWQIGIMLNISSIRTNEKSKPKPEIKENITNNLTETVEKEPENDLNKEMFEPVEFKENVEIDDNSKNEEITIPDYSFYME